MALPFGRATFFGPGGAKGGSVFSEFRGTGCVFVVRGIRKENVLWCPERKENGGEQPRIRGTRKGNML